MLSWNAARERVEKFSIASLKKIFLIEENIPADLEARLEKFYLEHRTEVSLRLTDTRNAVERCFALFGAYDKMSRIEPDGKYFLTIRYHDFDEDEVFERIVSLGAAAVVLEPERLRRRVIERLLSIKKILEED